MEEIVNRIRALCRSKNTSITKIEEELHFANGTIGKWKNGKRTPPLEKVILIAERLGTTPEYILRGEQKEKPAPKRDGLKEVRCLPVVRVFNLPLSVVLSPQVCGQNLHLGIRTPGCAPAHGSG